MAVVASLAAPPGASLAQPAHRPEGSWLTYRPVWDVGEVGGGERSLELSYLGSSCGGAEPWLRTTVRETRTDVIVSVELEVQQVPPRKEPLITLCLPPKPVLLALRLKHRLAGRTIRGRAPQVLSDLRPGVFPSGGEGEVVTVPNLIGFSPRDAAHALMLHQLDALRRRVGGHPGLPRVVAQAVPPGTRVPAGARVRISIAGE